MIWQSISAQTAQCSRTEFLPFFSPLNYNPQFAKNLRRAYPVADYDDVAMNSDYSYLKQSRQRVNAADSDDAAMNFDRPSHGRKSRECRRPGEEGVNKGALINISKYKDRGVT